ncbi:sulfurtransferase [Halalkalibacillus halophilus]|uniref:sulfurtransferase n=1 Tax=Halalkalibacillus halophilus TaxID=392827 RepID=UPI00068420CE|nr:sulfurtransferase [Halalkalibacillus halophilus]
MLISAMEAFEMIKHEKIICVDCRFQLGEPEQGKHSYLHGHLPQAIYADLEKDLSGEVKETGGRHPLPELNSFIEFLKNNGIDKDTKVIVYDENLAFASRFYWMLQYTDHENAYLLNGGWQEWVKLGYPMEKGNVAHSPKSEYGDYQVNKNMLATQEEVQFATQTSTCYLLDSRSPERYRGEYEPIDQKAGHIPNAINYDWQELMDRKGMFKEVSELESRFSNLDKNKEVIVYCGSGVTAVPNVIGLWSVGFKSVKLYVGSFSDWITNDKNKVETF